MKTVVGVYLIAGALLLVSPAFACSDGEISVGFGCLPDPTRIPDQSRFPIPPVPPGTPPILNPHEQLVQQAGAALQEWIQDSRNSSIGTSQPIPPNIRQQLTGYIPDAVLNVARYKIGDTGFVSLPGISTRYGDARALTAIDVIVFDNAQDVEDVALWAHELTHVKQYMEWGVHSFAIQYARNYNDVENPAYAAQNAFKTWQAAHNTPVPAPARFPPPPPPATGNFCSTPLGRYGPGPFNPIGSACYHDGPQGRSFGQVSN
ncbi:eCIS core domain-containing protein [Paraburkholderia dipogonis]|uniref:eCIS core domain-containing protein n=1 Tax=Paraburkholderia dipogonis TaxID=1211383 RepID=UPI0038B78F74